MTLAPAEPLKADSQVETLTEQTKQPAALAQKVTLAPAEPLKADSPLAPAPDALPMNGKGARAKIAAKSHAGKPRAAKHLQAHRGGTRKKTVAAHEGRHRSQEVVKTTHNKAGSKAAALPQKPAKTTMRAEKTTSKKPKKHARQ